MKNTQIPNKMQIYNTVQVCMIHIQIKLSYFLNDVFEFRWVRWILCKMNKINNLIKILKTACKFHFTLKVFLNNCTYS